MPDKRCSLAALAVLVAVGAGLADDAPKPATTLPGTKPLTMTGDVAAQLVNGVDRFLLREIEAAAKNREKFWKRDFSSPRAYAKSIAPNRKRLAHILGVRDKRVPFKSPELVGTLDEPALVGKGANYEIFAVRWTAFGEVHGEGLLLVPTKGKPIADVVAIPDADVTPEQLCGLMPGVKPESQYARRLAESGCRVIVPTLIDRTYEARNGRAKMTNREFIYRSAFELGRHLIGYEVQKVLAAVDWFAREGGGKATIGVIGWGEGGMLALYAGALDTRIKAVCVSGYYGNRDRIWEQPIDRNVFGLLEQFGDAELAAMYPPRPLLIETITGPEMTLPSEGGAPARLVSPPGEDARKEFSRVGHLLGGGASPKLDFDFGSHTSNVPPGGSFPVEWVLYRFAGAKLGGDDKPPEHLRKSFDPKPRQRRQLAELDRHNQQLLEDAQNVRRDWMPIADQHRRPDDQKKLDTSSLAAYEKSVERYREFFAKEVIGRFDHKLLPANARTRLHSESDKWTIYQVVLDVFPDVIAYGLLILPKNLKPGEKRPVVVCQHGLEGKPEDCIGEKRGYGAYKAFAMRLAERGFVTFAPQNLYIGHDRFRTLQRKANPLGKTLFSVIVPQHQQITDWLKTLPFVDGERIGFYGLSYGGKTAMRVPPLVKNYCLSICSADFNDWVWKNASTRSPYSYVWSGEYEIFEFDLGSTFNYAEMAALIAPRPFMVERGHFDTVAPDERVALEFAKVRHLYQAKLGIGERAAIEWFVGPHTINGKGTFDFLHKHLKWPPPGEKK
jgi:dienelactone hydrolase